MLIHPNFDPVAIHLGPVGIHWYGITYLVAFVLFIFLARQRLKQLPALSWTKADVDDLLTYGVLGVILGGRLGYVLFYKPSFYLSHPLDIIKVWEGGMAFHGGMLGVILAMLWFARKKGVSWFTVTDFIAPCVPTGLAMGRLGNFINGELYGRVTSQDFPLAMLFQSDPQQLPRHPSQLYQFACEGILLFIVLWLFAKKPRPTGAVSGLFLLGYGLARFAVEYTREPDDFLGILSLGFSMGQWLSLPMILGGVALLYWSSRQKT